MDPLARPAYEAYLRGELNPFRRRPKLRTESVYEQDLPQVPQGMGLQDPDMQRALDEYMSRERDPERERRELDKVVKWVRRLLNG
ncbi:hypothetical protein [Mycobacteroides abscessus]